MEKKFKSIDDIISLGKRIQFIKVSSLVLKFKGETFLQPLSYRKNLNNNIAVYIKVKNLKENSFGRMSSASFICREIINILEVSNDFVHELFSLLSLDDEDISEYMSLKGVFETRFN